MFGKKGPKIVIGKIFDQRSLERIKKAIPNARIVQVDSEEAQDREMKDADILFTRIMPGDPTISDRLKWVQFMWEGVDHMTTQMKNSDVLLTNASGIHSGQMAEHVFAYLLNLSRMNRDYFRLQERREWLPWKEQPRLKMLKGSTIGILGYGRIGVSIAAIARGFGMDIIAMKRNPDRIDEEKPVPDIILGRNELDQLLSGSDHVVVALPHTSETEGMIGAGEFKTMKKDAFFVNVGRGPIVDEKALIDALKNKEIAGAGLDVFDVEPLPSESPLWEMDNVIITPHSSVGGDPADDEIIDLFIENYRRMVNGERMKNPIDKEIGY